MSLIEVLLRKRRRIHAGPTGGLAIPRGAVNGWGTAADFYDSVGVGIKVFDGEQDRGSVMGRVSQLGIRHVRDGAIPSWTVFLTAAFGRAFWDALVQRNRSLPAPWLGDLGHPIFLAAINDPWGPSLANAVTQMYQANPLSTAQGAPYRVVTGTDYTPQALMQFYGGGHTHYDGNAGSNSQLPYIGNPDPNWPASQPELPWEAVALLLGPNEPLGPPAGVLPTDGQWGQQARELSAWVHSMWVAKNQQTGTGYGQGGVTLSGFRRIVTEQGLSTSAPSIKQIPQVGYVPVDRDFVYNFDANKAPPGTSLMFDISRGGPNEVDVGDDHPYWFGEEPSEERMLGSGIGITNFPAYFDGSRDINNGSQFPTPSASRGKDPNRILPIVHTEWGLIDRDDFSPTAAPRDVNAEYTVRQVLLAWYWGVRRTYVYQLMDLADSGVSEFNFGLYDLNGNRKPSGNALRNVLQLVGFSEPASNKRKLAITVAGYPTGQVNQSHDLSGNVYRQTAKKLHSFQIQQDDTHTLLVLSPQVKLWEPTLGNRNASNTGFQSLGNPTAGRLSPATETLTITLPTDVTAAQVAWPTRGLAPNGASYTWSAPDTAMTQWDTLTITNNQITVAIDRYTKLVRLTMTGAPPPPPPPPPPPVAVTPALVSTSDASLSVPAANSLGAELVRMSFPVTTSASSIDAYAGFYADIGTKLLLCATFNGTMPTQAEAENVATWATRFGPSGTYWSSYTGTDQPIDNIEFGHETSYQYQYGDVEANVGAGDWWNNTTYTTRAANYATRFSQAKAAIVATGKAVGLLCQADDGGSSQPNWVNTMYFAVANLHTLVSGWVIHSYGPGWEAKMDRLISQTGALGPASVPIDVTSVGIATDDGNALDDNLLWPVNMTYAEAASALSATLQGMKGKATLSGRLRTLAIRDAHDLSDHGANTARDNYFGALKHDLSEKNEYSTAVRTEFGGQVSPPGDPSEPPILLTVTKGPYAAGTSYATAISGATSGDVIGLGAGSFNWGSQTPPAGVMFQGVSTGDTVITGEMHCTNANTKFRNLTLRAITAASQKSVLEINANGIEIDWCDIDGSLITHTTAPKPSSVFIGGIAIQVQDVKVRHSKVRGPVNGDSQSHACYVANPGPGCLVEQCWIYGFPGYGLHFNTNGSDLLANRNVIADSALRGAVVFDTASGSGPQNNTIRNCILTAQNTASGVGPIHVVAGSNFADNNKFASLGVTTPGTGTLTQSSNVVTSITYQDAAARDYRVPGDTDFQFIPGPLPSQPPPPPPPPPTTLPIVVPSVGATAATLRTGSTVGPRLHLKAVNVWGLRDYITTTFGPAQYQARATVAATIKAWGGNCIRFRMLADDYNNAPSANTGGLTKAQIVQQVKDWRDTVVGQGMYFCPCTWDALDGPFSGSSWAANGYRVHQMFADVYAVLGADPMVIYEVTNEPNNITFGDGTGSGQWDTNMRASILYFRETMGYKGVLVIDPINWANSGTGAAGYSDGVYSNIEAYDAARAGMGGKHQIVWAKHDYANEYSGKVWDPNAWIAGAGGSQIKHLIWENEFGNYNGSAATVDATWSQNAAVFFRDRFVSQQNYVGAAPFLFGPWFDANAITASDNLTPTNPWGQTVRTNYLGSGGVTPPPPPVGWTPGMVGGGDWAKGSQASQAVGVKVVRGHDVDPGASAASIDSLVLNYFNRGIRVFLLANFDANPSTAQAQNLATWATRFGPGGSFWQANPGLNESVLAIRHIEFGNEHSYQYRRGDQPGDASYASFAQTYALRFRDAAQAIAATGRAVDLLCQADDGGSGSPVWVNSMYAAVPNLHTFVGGWTVHPYGPGGINKLRNTINFTAARGAPGTIPLDITEAGISSDDGNNLSDNYGWPTNLTYSAAASTYSGYLNAIRADGQVGPRLRHWCYYQAYDQAPHGANNNRETYFGALQNNLTDKGAFSPYIRSLMAS